MPFVRRCSMICTIYDMHPRKNGWPLQTFRGLSDVRKLLTKEVPQNLPCGMAKRLLRPFYNKCNNEISCLCIEY